MAIDTAEKRRSLSFVVVVSPGVTPNSSKDADWRSEVGFGYPFDDEGGVVPPAFEVDHVQATVKIDDLGYHLLESDLAYYVSSSNLDRFNLNSADLGWKIKQASKRWNIKKG
jgi:hypothetical protein